MAVKMAKQYSEEFQEVSKVSCESPVYIASFSIRQTPPPLLLSSDVATWHRSDQEAIHL